MKVTLEKMMEQLNGENCYLCFYREHPKVEKWTKQVWLNHLEKECNKKICQCCLDSKVTFSTCVLLGATLEETKLIHPCVGSPPDCNSIVKSV